jgi:hypothetical protein
MPKIFWSKLHSHMIESWKWMEGQMLTGRWLRCDRTLAAGSGQFILSTDCVRCDQTLERSSDRTLRGSIRSTPVRFQRRESVTGPWGFSVRSSPVSIQWGFHATGRVRSVVTGPCQRPVNTFPLARGLNWPERPVNTIGASGHPAEAHNGSFFRLSYK